MMEVRQAPAMARSVQHREHFYERRGGQGAVTTHKDKSGHRESEPGAKVFSASSRKIGGKADGSRRGGKGMLSRTPVRMCGREAGGFAGGESWKP